MSIPEQSERVVLSALLFVVGVAALATFITCGVVVAPLIRAAKREKGRQ